jgi:hypothetical protein
MERKLPDTLALPPLVRYKSRSWIAHLLNLLLEVNIALCLLLVTEVGMARP